MQIFWGDQNYYIYKHHSCLTSSSSPFCDTRFRQWGHKQASFLHCCSSNTDTRGAIGMVEATVILCPFSTCITVLCVHALLQHYASCAWHVSPILIKKPLSLYILVIWTSHHFGILLFHIHWSVLLTQQLISMLVPLGCTQNFSSPPRHHYE